MPKAGQKFVEGLKRVGQEVIPRTQRGIYVESEEFERIKQLAGSPSQAKSAEDRQARLRAYQIVPGIVQTAQIEALDNPGEDEIDTLKKATKQVLERTQSVSPRQKAAMIATLSSCVPHRSRARPQGGIIGSPNTGLHHSVVTALGFSLRIVTIVRYIAHHRCASESQSRRSQVRKPLSIDLPASSHSRGLAYA